MTSKTPSNPTDGRSGRSGRSNRRTRADVDAGAEPQLLTPLDNATSAETTSTTSAPEPAVPTHPPTLVTAFASSLFPNARPVRVDENRAVGVGGSDAAAILGVSPFRSRLDVWMEKTGHPMWTPKRETPNMRWGTMLEPLLANEYERTAHVRVEQSPGRIIHPNGVQFANVDRFVLDGNGVAGVWEGKVASDPRAWEEGVPLHYLLQVQQYMAVTGLPWCDVSVLLPGGDFRTFRVDADLELQLDIESGVLSFWNRYVARMVTPPEASVEIRFPAPVRQEPLVVVPGSELDIQFKTLLEIGRRVKSLLVEYDVWKETIKEQVAEYERVDGPSYRLLYRATKPPEKIGWEAIATSLWNTLEIVRRFTPNPHPDLAPHLNPALWETLQSLYTRTGKATRPFDLDSTKED